jgi:H+-translocating NAD(P) transhydrogenase subunit beta
VSDLLRNTITPLVYICAAVSFFFGIKFSAHRGSARSGAPLMLGGLALVILGVCLDAGAAVLVAALPFVLAGGVVGVFLGMRIAPTAPPTAFGWLFAATGLGAALLALSALLHGDLAPVRLVSSLVAAALGLAAAPIGAGLGFSKPSSRADARLALAAALAGFAAAFLGIAFSNVMLLIAGGVGGAGGIALARSVGEAAGEAPLKLIAADPEKNEPYTSACDVEEAASILGSAARIVLVPGFGMAAAQAQHALNELAQLLEKHGAKVSWLIHPSAGVLPGHMNVVLDEAGVPHEDLVELGDAKGTLADADLVLVIGASDIVNPAAANDEASPLWGLPVPDLSHVPTVLAIKRTLGPGASGTANPLFEQPNTSLVFGDAKKVTQALVAELKRHA